MKFSAFAAIASTLVLFAAASTFASSQPSGAPVQVLNLQYQPYNVADEDVGGNGNAASQPGVMVTFKNVTTKPIHAVVFSIQDSSGFPLGTVSRHGTFSPGVTITRYFGNVKMKDVDKHGDPAKAVPIEIGYTDGSTWDAPK
jgi:hypothetical protein